MNSNNRRQNIRFRTRIPEVVRLNFKNQVGYEEVDIKAIKIDENIKCLSCILVTPFEIQEGEPIQYHETDDFITQANVIRVQEIEPTVYKLVIEYEN